VARRGVARDRRCAPINRHGVVARLPSRNHVSTFSSRHWAADGRSQSGGPTYKEKHMNRLMIVAGAAALLAVSSFAASAAEVTGAITSVDAAAGTVSLDDGNTYTLPVDFDVASLQAGAKVTITYEEADGKMTITKVEAAS
jgi:Cu/Ag efflux protein CusF